MTMNLSGTMSIEIGGKPSEVTMEQTQTTTFKTTDENRPAYNESCAHKHVGSKLEQEL